MAPLEIYTLIILLFSYLNIHVLATNDGRPPFSHLRPGHVDCWRSGLPYLESDCRVALTLIPSGRFTFEGGDPPTWSIETPAQRRKFLPAAFRYRTCTIEVVGTTKTLLPQSLVGSLAWTMYFHVWPAAREAAARVLQTCSGRTGGAVTQTLTFHGHGPYLLSVIVDRSPGLRVTPQYHVYTL
jgi:hypothetical protein